MVIFLVRIYFVVSFCRSCISLSNWFTSGYFLFIWLCSFGSFIHYPLLCFTNTHSQFNYYNWCFWHTCFHTTGHSFTGHIFLFRPECNCSIALCRSPFQMASYQQRWIRLQPKRVVVQGVSKTISTNILNTTRKISTVWYCHWLTLLRAMRFRFFLAVCIIVYSSNYQKNS